MKTNQSSTSRNQNSYAPRAIALGTGVALLLCAVALSHGQTAGKATANPVGTYTLLSVDGKKVPCTIKHDGAAMNVHSGTFTITTNGQVTSVMIISVGDRKNVRVERSATCTVKESELTMKWQNAGTTKGRVVGQTFTMTNEGMAYVYKK